MKYLDDRYTEAATKCYNMKLEVCTLLWLVGSTWRLV